MPAQSPLARVVAEIIDAWAVRKGIVYERADSEALEFETADGGHLPAWVKYLLAFDVKYRERRLHFLIEGQNRLYQHARSGALRRASIRSWSTASSANSMPASTPCGGGRAPRSTAPRCARWWPTFSRPSRRRARRSISMPMPAGSWSSNVDKLDRLIERLAAEIDLDAKTRELDDLLASLDPAEWHPEARREVLVNYLGFPFWDVLTFPMTSAREIGELNEILIDRISPQDARALKGFDGSESLKGIGFAHFAAFFSRAYRENDYLLGRLHALDRLIDIVCDAAGIEPKCDGRDRRAGAQEARLRAHSRCRGEASHPQQAADRQPAADGSRNLGSMSLARSAAARRLRRRGGATRSGARYAY